MNKVRALLTAALVFFALGEVQAGPWVRDAGDGYVKLGGASFVGDQYYRAGVATELDSRAESLSLYGEVGLGDGWQLVIYLPYQIATNETPGGVSYVNHTLGDARVQVDKRLTDAFPLSLSLELKAPLYQVVAEQELSGSQEAWRTNFPDVGDGNVDLTLKLQAGASLDAIAGWASMAVGYTKRTGTYIDSLYFSAQLGSWIWPKHVNISVYTQGNLTMGTDAFPELLASRESVSVEGTVSVMGLPASPDLCVMFSLGQVVYARYGAKGRILSMALARSW